MRMGSDRELTTQRAGLETLMDARNDAQIKKMYKLFAKVGGLRVLNSAFKFYVQVPLTTHTFKLDSAHSSTESDEEHRD